MVLFLLERVDRRPRRCASTNTSEIFEQIKLIVQRATVLRKQLINHLHRNVNSSFNSFQFIFIQIEQVPTAIAVILIYIQSKRGCWKIDFVNKFLPLRENA